MVNQTYTLVYTSNYGAVCSIYYICTMVTLRAGNKEDHRYMLETDRIRLENKHLRQKISAFKASQRRATIAIIVSASAVLLSLVSLLLSLR